MAAEDPRKDKVPVASIQPVKKEDQEGRGVYTKMYSGLVTNTMADMIGKSLEMDPITGTASVTSNGVTMNIKDYKSGSFGVSTHKLLCRCISEYTRNPGSLGVSFSIRDYAIKCKRKIQKDPTKDDKKETLRAKSSYDKFRSEVIGDVMVLNSITFSSFKESIKGRIERIDLLNILGAAHVDGDYVYVEFTKSMGDYLQKHPLTQYSELLYGVDERNPNAYSLAIKMTGHYFMDHNLLAGTASLLSVKTLLESTDLKKAPAELGRNRSRWVERIKDPLENALDTLKRNDVLEDWKYCHSKGVELTDEEAYKLVEDFNVWANTLVSYTLKDAPDQTARLEAKEEEKKQRQAKAKKKASKKKKPAAPDPTSESEETDT